MSRCANCDFNLANTNPAEVVTGHCERCNALVCFRCGCTMERACVRQYVDGLMTCSFEQLQFGEAAPGQLGMALQSTPGICSFCFWKLAEHLYLQATADEPLLVSLESLVG